MWLTPGERLRWQVNYRHSTTSSGEWIYSLHTLHLAVGTVDRDAFLQAPTHQVDELADLY